MQRAGKVVASSLKLLVTGSSSRLGNTITKELLKKGSTVYTVDKRILTNQLINDKHFFHQADLADNTHFQKYLTKIGQLDALVNCAGYRSSYNYYLSYLISRNILEKFKDNDTNEFGCRGCIINLVNLSGQYDEEYFKKQTEFEEKYKINTETIDDDIYQLADELTAARVRCNTVMVNAKTDPKAFADLVTHIIEDQYIAGQVINMEDNLRKEETTMDDIRREIFAFPRPTEGEAKYIKPPEHDPKPLGEPEKPIALPVIEPVKT